MMRIGHLRTILTGLAAVGMFAAIAGPASAATGSVRPDATSTTEGCWYTAKYNNQDLYVSPLSEQPNGAVIQKGDVLVSAPRTFVSGSGSGQWVYVMADGPTGFIPDADITYHACTEPGDTYGPRHGRATAAGAASRLARPDVSSLTKACAYTVGVSNTDLYTAPGGGKPNGAVLQPGDQVISAPNTVGSGSDPWVFVWVGSADFYAATGFVHQDALNGTQPSCDTPTGPYENP